MATDACIAGGVPDERSRGESPLALARILVIRRIRAPSLPPGLMPKLPGDVSGTPKNVTVLLETTPSNMFGRPGVPSYGSPPLDVMLQPVKGVAQASWVDGAPG